MDWRRPPEGRRLPFRIAHKTAKNLLLTARKTTRRIRMKRAAGLLLSLGVILAPSVLRAQDTWPSRPITFVVPYGAGGYTDLVGRLTARFVEKALGKPVVVDNRAGAGGHCRHPGGRECAARWLHVLRLQHRRHLGGAVRSTPEGELRPVARPRSRWRRQFDRTSHHRQEGPAAEDAGRACVRRQIQSGQAQLWFQRRWRLDPLFGRVVPGPHRHQGGAHPV